MDSAGFSLLDQRPKKQEQKHPCTGGRLTSCPGPCVKENTSHVCNQSSIRDGHPPTRHSNECLPCAKCPAHTPKTAAVILFKKNQFVVHEALPAPLQRSALAYPFHQPQAALPPDAVQGVGGQVHVLLPVADDDDVPLGGRRRRTAGRALQQPLGPRADLAEEQAWPPGLGPAPALRVADDAGTPAPRRARPRRRGHTRGTLATVLLSGSGAKCPPKWLKGRGGYLVNPLGPWQ